MNRLHGIMAFSLIMIGALGLPSHCQAQDKTVDYFDGFFGAYEWGKFGDKLYWRHGKFSVIGAATDWDPWQPVMLPNGEVTVVKDIAVGSIDVSNALVENFLIMVSSDNKLWWRRGVPDSNFAGQNATYQPFRWADGSEMMVQWIYSARRDDGGLLTIIVMGADGNRYLIRQSAKYDFKFDTFIAR